jgi:hypothetical protein
VSWALTVLASRVRRHPLVRRRLTCCLVRIESLDSEGAGVEACPRLRWQSAPQSAQILAAARICPPVEQVGAQVQAPNIG